jgi:hypothetical protein
MSFTYLTSNFTCHALFHHRFRAKLRRPRSALDATTAPERAPSCERTGRRIPASALLGTRWREPVPVFKADHASRSDASQQGQKLTNCGHIVRMLGRREWFTINHATLVVHAWWEQ